MLVQSLGEGVVRKREKMSGVLKRRKTHSSSTKGILSFSPRHA